jgi:hypothetical protein
MADNASVRTSNKDYSGVKRDDEPDDKIPDVLVSDVNGGLHLILISFAYSASRKTE